MSKCKYCGCGVNGCTGGCSWVREDVCSNCVISTNEIGKNVEAYISDPEVEKIEIVMTDKEGVEKKFLIVD